MGAVHCHDLLVVFLGRKLWEHLIFSLFPLSHIPNSPLLLYNLFILYLDTYIFKPKRYHSTCLYICFLLFSVISVNFWNYRNNHLLGAMLYLGPRVSFKKCVIACFYEKNFKENMWFPKSETMNQKKSKKNVQTFWTSPLIDMFQNLILPFGNYL